MGPVERPDAQHVAGLLLAGLGESVPGLSLQAAAETVNEYMSMANSYYFAALLQIVGDASQPARTRQQACVQIHAFLCPKEPSLRVSRRLVWCSLNDADRRAFMDGLCGLLGDQTLASVVPLASAGLLEAESAAMRPACDALVNGLLQRFYSAPASRLNVLRTFEYFFEDVSVTTAAQLALQFPALLQMSQTTLMQNNGDLDLVCHAVKVLTALQASKPLDEPGLALMYSLLCSLTPMFRLGALPPGQQLDRCFQATLECISRALLASPTLLSRKLQVNPAAPSDPVGFEPQRQGPEAVALAYSAPSPGQQLPILPCVFSQCKAVVLAYCASPESVSPLAVNSIIDFWYSANEKGLLLGGLDQHALSSFRAGFSGAAGAGVQPQPPRGAGAIDNDPATMAGAVLINSLACDLLVALISAPQYADPTRHLEEKGAVREAACQLLSELFGSSPACFVSLFNVVYSNTEKMMSSDALVQGAIGAAGQLSHAAQAGQALPAAQQVEAATSVFLCDSLMMILSSCFSANFPVIQLAWDAISMARSGASPHALSKQVQDCLEAARAVRGLGSSLPHVAPGARLALQDIPSHILRLAEATNVPELTAHFHACCAFVLRAVSAITASLGGVCPRRYGAEMLLESALECVSRMAQNTPQLLRTDIPGLMNQVLLPCVANGMLSGGVSARAVSSYAALCGPVPEVLGVMTMADMQADPRNPGQGLFGARVLCSALDQVRRLIDARETDEAKALIGCLNTESLPILDAAGAWRPMPGVDAAVAGGSGGPGAADNVSQASGVAVAYSVFAYCLQILQALLRPEMMVPQSFPILNMYLECLLTVSSFCLETYREAGQPAPVQETREVLSRTFEFIRAYASFPELDDALAVSTDMIAEVQYLPDCGSFEDLFTQHVGLLLRPVGQILFDMNRSDLHNRYMTLLASLLPVMSREDRDKALASCKSLWSNPATTALTRCSCLSFLHDLNALEAMDRAGLEYCQACLRESHGVIQDGLRADKAGRVYLDFQTAQLAKACVKLALAVVSSPETDQSTFRFAETIGATLSVISQVYDYDGNAANFAPDEVFNEAFMALAMLVLIRCAHLRDIKNFLNGSLIFNFVKKSLRVMQASNDPMVRGVAQNAYQVFQTMIMTK